MPSLCRTKHNRAKPMFELPSAIFLIADGNEFRFARFYIVCEEVPLGTPESPLIVCGLSDTLRECPNVAKTRNGMPATAWKKYVNFASKNLPPSVYSGTFLFSGISVILLITPKRTTLIAAISFNNRYQASDRNTPKSDKPPQNCAPDSCRQSGLC